MKPSKYSSFLLMLASSAVLMYITMYFTTYELNHVYFSWTRLYMTLIGIGGMALIMLLFMIHMYPNKVKNRLIIGLSLLLMGTSAYLVREQLPIDDVRWMKAMIPHHSIAILTSNRANIQDPEAKQLAEQIIEAQETEIAQMKDIIQRLENQ